MTRDRFEPEGRGGQGLPPRLDPRAGRPARRRPDSGEDRVAGSAPRGRARRSVLAVRVVGAVLSAVLLGTSGWGWYLGQVAQATVNRTDAIPSSGNEGTGGAMNLLLVGNDSRSSLTAEQESELHTGGDSGLNTDTMILVHVPADGSRASFVSFPRDSYVEIPGYGWDKLNAAYAYGYAEVDDSAAESQRQAGGAQLLVKTISSLTGLQINHYAEVDLLGFFNLTSVVGGVEVNLCKPVDEAKSGAVFPAGVQVISGADALKFVRQRYELPRGDLDRIVRQQVFIAGVLRKMLSDEVLMNLGKQRELVQAASESLTVDQNLNLLELAQQMQSVTAGSIEFQTVPNVGTDKAGSKSIVRLKDEASLKAFFADLSADPEPEPKAQPKPKEAPQTVPAAAVSVEVLNGSGTPGLAATAAAALTTTGFTVPSKGNADKSDHARTEIRHAPADKAMATTVAATLPGAKVVAVDTLTPGTVQLVLGTDFNAVGQPVDAPAPKPTVVAEDTRTAADTNCIN